MSATIGINKLKFVIFGAGHDYTLADSGDGNVQVFSNPFVPLNSLNYAGQWFFEVPDEYGEPMDAVKDDLAHCTFDPILGATFNTVGDVEVKCTYHREYIYDEETVIVEKTVKQTIEVVDHGTVSDSNNNFDLYSDGYGFYHPRYTGTVESGVYYHSKGSPTKVSSIPWRAEYLGDYPFSPFISASNLTDISELEYADVSNVKEIFGLVKYGSANDLDLTPIAKWDVSNCSEMIQLLYSSGITDISPLANWDTSSLEVIDHAFAEMKSLISLHGLENWNTSKVTDAYNTFAWDEKITNLNALANWDVSKVEDARLIFSNMTDLTDISGLANWNLDSIQRLDQAFYSDGKLTSVSALSGWHIKPTLGIESMFESCGLTSLVGLEGFDFSEYTGDMRFVFKNNYGLANLHGLEDWDVSNVKDFEGMFKGCPWITDISALADWDMSNGEDFSDMFYQCASVTTLSGIIWDLTSAVTMQRMFNFAPLDFSSKIGRNVYSDAYYYWDSDGTRYTYPEVHDAEHPLTQIFCDASEAQNWIVVGSGWSAFDNVCWINQPTWN